MKRLTVLVVLYIVITAALMLALPPMPDWRECFYPAADAALHAQSPYSVPCFYNPPWTVLFLIPFVPFGMHLSQAMLLTTMLFAYSAVLIKIGAPLYTLPLLWLSSPVLISINNGNLEWLVFLALLLPPRWGIFLAIIKPQVSLGLCVYWLVQVFRRGGPSGVIRTFMPVTVVTAICLIIFGPWFTRGAELVDIAWNVSMWPKGIPIGLALMLASLVLRRDDVATAASPFLSPYISIHSWSGVFLALTKLPLLLFVVIALQWYLFYTL